MIASIGRDGRTGGSSKDMRLAVLRSLLISKNWFCGAIIRDDRRWMIGGGDTSEHVRNVQEAREGGEGWVEGWRA